MIAWRTLACSVAVLCLAVPGCGDDGETGSGGFAGSNASNNNTTTDSTSSSTGTSTGAPGSSTTDPTTGPDTGTSTTIAPTTNGPTSTTSTTDPDTTTGDVDTSTTNTQTTQTTDPAGCGNGAIDPNEQCDGANLNGFTCESLGNAGGSLGCDPVTCTFDTSMCMGNSSSGTSG